MWISQFWYEKLPAIYIVSGAAVMPAFGKPAALSAALLMAAGALTWYWRRSYRASPTGRAGGRF